MEVEVLIDAMAIEATVVPKRGDRRNGGSDSDRCVPEEVKEEGESEKRELKRKVHRFGLWCRG